MSLLLIEHLYKHQRDRGHTSTAAGHDGDLTALMSSSRDTNVSLHWFIYS